MTKSDNPALGDDPSFLNAADEMPRRARPNPALYDVQPFYVPQALHRSDTAQTLEAEKEVLQLRERIVQLQANLEHKTGESQGLCRKSLGARGCGRTTRCGKPSRFHQAHTVHASAVRAMSENPRLMESLHLLAL